MSEVSFRFLMVVVTVDACEKRLSFRAFFKTFVMVYYTLLSLKDLLISQFSRVLSDRGKV